jgi:hypothetical protein
MKAHFLIQNLKLSSVSFLTGTTTTTNGQQQQIVSTVKTGRLLFASGGLRCFLSFLLVISYKQSHTAGKRKKEDAVHVRMAAVLLRLSI